VRPPWRALSLRFALSIFRFPIPAHAAGIM
jgi:hypothetical protein